MLVVFFGGDIPYTVTIDPAPTDGPVSVPLYVNDPSGNPNGLTLPGTFVTVVPPGEPTETRDVSFITVGSSGTASGVIRVPSSGVTSPVQLNIHSSIKGYDFTSNPRSLSIPLVATPATSPEISISGPTSSVNEGDVAVFHING